MILILIVAFQLYNLSIPLFDYSQPFSYSTYVQLSPSFGTADMSNLKFAGYLVNYTADPWYGYLTIYTNSTNNTQVVSLTACSVDFFVENFPGTIFTQNMTTQGYLYQTLCLPDDFNQSLQLYGSTITDNFQYFEVTVTTFSGKAWTLHFIYKNQYIDPMNYDQPIQSYPDHFFFPGSTGTYQLLVDTANMNTSSGVIGQNQNTTETYSINPNTITAIPGTGQYNFMVAQFSRSAFTTYYTRSYLDIGTLFSQIGGFSQTIFGILGFLAVWYAEFKYHLAFADRVHPEKEDQGDELSRGERNLDVSMQHIEVKEEEEEITSANEGNYKKKNSNTKESHKQFGFWSFVKYTFLYWIKCCKGRDLAIIKNRKEQTKKTADIGKLFKKMRELEDMKKLILNEEQLKFFRAVQRTKPIPKEKEVSINEEILYKLFKKITKNKERVVNKRLLEMMDPKVKESFEARFEKEKSEENLELLSKKQRHTAIF